jgi:hypothetical protein
MQVRNFGLRAHGGRSEIGIGSLRASPRLLHARDTDQPQADSHIFSCLFSKFELLLTLRPHVRTRFGQRHPHMKGQAFNPTAWGVSRHY